MTQKEARELVKVRAESGSSWLNTYERFPALLKSTRSSGSGLEIGIDWNALDAFIDKKVARAIRLYANGEKFLGWD